MSVQRGSIWRIVIACLASFWLAGDLPFLAPAAEDGTGVAAAADDAQSVPLIKVRMIHSLMDGCLRFLPDDRTLAVLDRSDDGVRLLDIHKGETYRRFVTEELTAEYFEFTSDGSRLFTCSAKGICHWETATGRRLPGVDGEPAGDLAISPDGYMLATRGGSTISLWNVEKVGGAITLAKSFAPEWQSNDDPPKRHNSAVTALAFSRDGRFLLGGVTRGFVLAWDLATADPPASSTWRRGNSSDERRAIPIECQAMYGCCCRQSPECL